MELDQQQFELLKSIIEKNYIELDKKVDQVIQNQSEINKAIKVDHDEMIILKFGHAALKDEFEKHLDREEKYGKETASKIEELKKAFEKYMAQDTARFEKLQRDELTKEKNNAEKKAELWKQVIIKLLPYIGTGGIAAAAGKFIF